MPSRIPTSVLAPRSVIDAVGEFHRSPVGEGIDWYLRFEELGMQALMLREVVYRRRVHQANQGVRFRERHKDRLTVLKAALDRRRAALPA